LTLRIRVCIVRRKLERSDTSGREEDLMAAKKGSKKGAKKGARRSTKKRKSSRKR
jgi:hypothetical protein